MSKYTTQVRFICEQYAGLTESAGFTEVDDILTAAYPKIITDTTALYNEDRRPEICKKLLKHYYTREISAETVGLWKLWINEIWALKLPIYNKLWLSAELEFNPLYEVDYNKDGTRNDTNSAENQNSSETNATTGSTSYNLFSDTPQGGLTGIDENAYLTNATKGTADATSKDTSKASGKSSGKTESKYNEHIYGKTSSASYAKLLQEYREILINYDEQFINEFKDCFMHIW